MSDHKIIHFIRTFCQKFINSFANLDAYTRNHRCEYILFYEKIQVYIRRRLELQT